MIHVVYLCYNRRNNIWKYMHNFTQKNRQKYQKAIVNNLDDYLYRSKRYHVDFSLAIAFCNTKVDFNNLISRKRKTDKLIVLEDNLCCIVLDCAPADCAAKAASNLQNDFKKKYSDKELFTCVVTSKDYENGNSMVNSLLDILEHSISNRR